MKKHIPNTLTCLNLLTGAIGCIHIIEGGYHQAIYFVLLAGLFDFLDGFVARILRVQSAIGKELDSLADMVSFGLLPALYLVMMMRAQAPDMSYLPYLGLLVAAFSALRLARFNVDDRQSDQFIGLATPANTIMVTSLSFLPGSFEPNIYALSILVVLSSGLLVSSLPLIALKFKGVGWKENKWKYILLATIAILVATLQLSALPFVVPAYLLISFWGNFTSKPHVETNA